MLRAQDAQEQLAWVDESEPRYFPDFGPAKNQMMKPTTGSKSTSSVHNTFLPVVVLL